MLGWLVQVTETASRILVSHFESSFFMTLRGQSGLSTLMICLVLACLSLCTIAFSQPQDASSTATIRSLVQRTTARTVQLASSTIPWWEDLSPPFSLPEEDDDMDHHRHPSQPNVDSQVVHFCFLVHGHRGLGKDLSYLRMVMQRGAERERRRRWKEDHTKKTATHLVVHTCCCNERKTDDGVANGGDRLMKEMMSVMRREMRHLHHDAEITVSMVGNSLGGIYARYAIAELAKATTTTTSSCQENNEMWLDGQYRLHFNVFCTTATPHLGVSKHTYLPLPRSAEIRVARALGDTGRDLFRINTLLKRMATTSPFLKPLSQFRKRVAYANAYGTDFPVPATTAAFLSTNSTYPHHFEEDEEAVAATTTTTRLQQESPTTVGMLDNGDESKTNEITDTIRYFKDNIRIATLHTKAQETKTTTQHMEDHHDTIMTTQTSEEREQDLVQMSTCLDSLGWKKVFIDVRKEIPLRLSLPKRISLRKNWLLLGDSCTSFGATSSTEGDENDGGGGLVRLSSDDDIMDDDDEEIFQEPACIHTLRQRGQAVQSRDVASALSLPLDNELSFPIGHNLMVAMSRDRLSTLINKGGRPVMDALAKELVEDIFAWETTTTTTTTTSVKQ